MSIIEKYILNKWYIVVTAAVNAVFAETVLIWKGISLHINALIILVVVMNGLYWSVILLQVVRKKQSLDNQNTAVQWNRLFWLIFIPYCIIALTILSRGYYYVFFALTSILFFIWMIGNVYSNFNSRQNGKNVTHQKKTGAAVRTITNKYTWFLFSVIVLAGVLIRVYFIFNGQLDGDEGNYLYDAKLVLDGLIPKVDFASRGVAYVALLAAWLKVVGVETIIAARAFHVVVFALSLLGMFLLLKKVCRGRVALWGIGVFALNPFSAYLGTILKTESIQELLHLWVAVAAVYFYLDHKKRYFILLLVLGGIDVLVRPSSIIYLVFVVTVLFLLFVRKKLPYLIHLNNLPIFGALSLVIGVPVMSGLLAYSDYLQRIFPKLYYLSRLNINKFANSVHSTINFVSGVTGKVLYVEIFLIIAIGILVVSLLFKNKNLRYGLYGIFSFWILFVAKYFYSSIKIHSILQLPVLIGVSTIMVGVVALVLVVEKNKISIFHSDALMRLLIFVSIYLLILFSFYSVFVRFHVGYTYEFLLPLHILSGYGIYSLINNSKTRLTTIGLCFIAFVMSMSVFIGNYSNQDIIVKYHFRRHSISAVQQATEFIKKNTSLEEEVFSGNTIFAANSDRRLVMNISHPQYDYHDHPSRKKESELLDYLRDNDIQYAIYDYKMQYFYLDENDRIDKYLTKNFYPIYVDAENDIQILKKISE